MSPSEADDIDRDDSLGDTVEEWRCLRDEEDWEAMRGSFVVQSLRGLPRGLRTCRPRSLRLFEALSSHADDGKKSQGTPKRWHCVHSGSASSHCRPMSSVGGFPRFKGSVPYFYFPLLASSTSRSRLLMGFTLFRIRQWRSCCAGVVGVVVFARSSRGGYKPRSAVHCRSRPTACWMLRTSACWNKARDIIKNA